MYMYMYMHMYIEVHVHCVYVHVIAAIHKLMIILKGYKLLSGQMLAFFLLL